MKGYKKNKLQQLRGFCAVIEEKTVQKAAEKIATAQSNVSLQIASLERDLKLTLFIRERQRLIPTPEALRLYKICKKSIAEIDFIFENASTAIKHDNDNKIRIAAHSYMLSHVLPPYFKKMMEKNPKVQFELYNSSYEEAMNMLDAGNIDFVVQPAIKDNLPSNISIYDFYKCTFGFGMSINHPLAQIPEKDINWNLVAKYDFITMGQKMTAQGLKAIVGTSGINSRFKLHNGTWEICMGVVKEGLSISFGDANYGKGHEGISMKKCPHLMPEYQFNILTNKAFKISKASKDLLRLLIGKL